MDGSVTGISGVPAATETDVLWFLPTHGDGRYLASEVGAPDAHVQLALGVRRCGFEAGESNKRHHLAEALDQDNFFDSGHPWLAACPEVQRRGCPGQSPGMTSNYRSPIAKSIYFLAGAILESAGLAASGGASDLPVVSAAA